MNSTHIKSFKILVGYDGDDFMYNRISVIIRYKLSRHKYFRVCKFSINAYFKDEDIPDLAKLMYMQFKQAIFTK